MPALTKKDIRAHFPHVLPPAQDMDLGIATGEIQLVETSGTTDDKITNIWNQAWWDASERSSWKLNSHVMKLATGNHREAILVNARNVGFISDEVDLPMEGRRLSRFLYLNEKTDPLSWSRDIMDRMVAELRLFQPQVLEANPSMLARLSRYILQSGADVFQPGVIVFTYEYPTVFHCRQIGRVFNVPMVSSYGTTEVGYVFMQCEEGKLHQNIDYCRVDFQPFRPEHGGPMLGRILVTPFQNPWNYLVRFNTGDLVRLAENGRCKCGRDAGLILSSVQGRAVNLTMTMRGRIVTLAELDAHMSRLDGVDEYKLVQTDPQTYECHLSSHRRDRDRLQREASEIVKGLYGKDAKAPIVFEADIAPEMSGKYLISRALFPIDVEEYLDRRSDIEVEKTDT
jgi:phenylacetate-coenzyme A ligase PaaK-like adenylate-forming protein